MIINHELEYHVHSRDNKNDIKRILDSVYNKLKYLFSDISVAEKNILFSSSLLNVLFLVGPIIQTINSGKIYIEAEKNYLAVRVNISYSYIFIANTLIGFIISLLSFLYTASIYQVLFIPLIAIIFTIFKVQFSTYRFNSFLNECLESVGVKQIEDA